MMTNGDPEGRIFLSHTRIMDSFFLLTIKYLFLYWINMKKASKNPEYAEMRHGDVILILQ